MAGMLDITLVLDLGIHTLAITIDPFTEIIGILTVVMETLAMEILATVVTLLTGTDITADIMMETLLEMQVG